MGNLLSALSPSCQTVVILEQVASLMDHDQREAKKMVQNYSEQGRLLISMSDKL